LKLDQLKLYVDTLYAKALYKEKKYEEAAKVAGEWRKRTDWKLEPRGIDQAEKYSYASEQTLRNMLAGFDFAARLETVDKDPAKKLDLITEFLDHRDALAAADDLGDKCVDLLDAAKLEFDPESPKIGTELAKYPSVAGVSKKDDNLTLYVLGERLHALKRDRDGWQILSPKEAAKDFETYCKDVVKDRSTGNLRLFNVMKYEEEYAVDFPDGLVRVTTAEAEKLGRGQALPADHPLSKAIQKAGDSALVLYANPLMLKSSRWLAEGDNFAFQIQKAYPEMRVYRDPLTKKTDGRAKQLTARALAGPADVVVVVADKSFKRVEDGKVISNLAGEGGEFEKAGIKVIKFNGEPADPAWAGGKEKVVIVITGHSNEQLAGYTKALGEAGYLDGNYVVFNSCETPLTRELSFNITGEYNAAAVFCYEGKILAKDVKKALGMFASGLKDAIDAKKKVSLPDFLWKTIRESSLNGVWQISRVVHRSEEGVHA
jgi:hypothetical protein